MRDFVEYLRAYRGYVSANLGWGKALRFALVWLAGMFAPLASKTLLELPNWVAVTWMIVWAFLGYILRRTECGNIIATKLRAQVRGGASKAGTLARLVSEDHVTETV